MKRVKPQDLFQRSIFGQSNCISIYTNDLKNLENQIQEIRKLASGDLSQNELNILLDPIRDFRESKKWKSLKAPAAFFVSRNFAGYLQLPFPTKDLAVAALSFHVKPLIKWLEREKPFFVIQVREPEILLFQGNFQGLNLLQRFDFDSPERTQQILEGLDRTLFEFVRNTRLPVLIYAPQKLGERIHRKVRFRKLIVLPFQDISEKAGLTELHKHSVLALEPHHQKIESADIEKYWTAKMEGRTSGSLQEIVNLALDGKVKHLFINERMNVWGHINFYTGDLIYNRTQRDSMDDDILDDLAELVLYHNGKVTVLGGDRMPESHAAAAILSAPLKDSLQEQNSLESDFFDQPVV